MLRSRQSTKIQWHYFLFLLALLSSLLTSLSVGLSHPWPLAAPGFSLQQETSVPSPSMKAIPRPIPCPGAQKKLLDPMPVSRKGQRAQLCADHSRPWYMWVYVEGEGGHDGFRKSGNRHCQVKTVWSLLRLFLKSVFALRVLRTSMW